jgi:hypothetical protein
MEVICTLAQTLIVFLAITLFIVGLVSVIGALGGFDSSPSPQQISRRTSAEIEQITREGKQAMDEVSEQYLKEIYDQVTH